MKYYIKSKGVTFGPVEDSKIKRYLETGFFSLNSMVSADLKNWLPVQNCISIEPEIIVKSAQGEDSQHVFRLTEDNVIDRSALRGHRGWFSANSRLLIYGVCSLLVVALLGVGGYCLFKFDVLEDVIKKSPADFQQVCQKYQSAVGVVTVTLEDSDGKLLSKIGRFDVSAVHPIGTAFAIGKNQFATNCHVAYGVKDQKSGVLEDIRWKIIASVAKDSGVRTEQEFYRYLDKNQKEIENLRVFLHNHVRVRSVEIRLAHSGGRALNVIGVQIHPRYQANPSREREFKNSEFDVAILTTAEDVDNPFDIASKSTLYKLASGQEIAYIGFPMEGLDDNGNMDLDRPEAIFKQGTINKITDFNNVFSTPEFNKSIIHDIPAAGGASGSPIFLANGKVVAILWGVTHASANGKVRIASAVQHNMAVRIDSLDIVKRQKIHDISEWLGEQK